MNQYRRQPTITYYLGVRSSAKIGIPSVRAGATGATKLRIPGVSNLLDKLRGNDQVEVLEEEYDQDITSSNLAHVRYNPVDEVLQIVFNSGGIYQYYNVPLTVYDGLTTAPSAGMFFHDRIRKVYDYDQIR